MNTRTRIAALPAVQAGWAFGVPEDGQAAWLDDVAAVCDHGGMFPELAEALDALFDAMIAMYKGDAQTRELAYQRCLASKAKLQHLTGSVTMPPGQHERPPDQAGGPVL